MERQKASALIQQFFLGITVNDDLIYRKDNFLHVKLGELSPYSLFTSHLNAIGEDPLASLGYMQEMIEKWLDLFFASVIVFHLDHSEIEYHQVEIEDNQDSWMSLGNDPAHILPKFYRVRWCVHTES